MTKMAISQTIKQRLFRPIPIDSLAAFRILFGAMMAFSILRFMAKGWVHELYVKPNYFFTYYGFSWVKPWPEWGLYLHFSLLALLALMIALGFYYRWSMILFFLGFTYVELLDQSNYLNHYYFISLIAFLMIWMPLAQAYSVDTWRKKEKQTSPPLNTLDPHYAPAWPLLTLRLQMAILYFFAGAAKLNPDWLFAAQPLKIWLQGQSGMPLIGPLLAQTWMAYAMSWAGTLYDLTIPFFLSWRKTRVIAYLAVVFFHVFTWMLFNIGVFPWVMIVATTAFFEPDWPRKFWSFLSRKGRKKKLATNSFTIPSKLTLTSKHSQLIMACLSVYFLIQIFLPLRHWLYPGNTLWTEEGFRFSWRVMLKEKNGALDYFISEPSTGRRWEVSPSRYLSPYQLQQMNTRPDMILALAHHIAEDFRKQGIKNPEVRVHSIASLNGRPQQTLIDPTVNLAQEKDSLWPKKWIVPLKK